jgi:benzoyl-CoA reductase subunit C
MANTEMEKLNMKILSELSEIQRNPYEYGTAYKKVANRKVVGYFCSYTPEELIFAADALPFRIFGVNENIQQADSHLQSYCCSLVRRSLEDGLSGHLNFLDGVIFPHTCDSIQRLSDIWRLNLSFASHIDIVLPVKLNTESARQYMIDVIKKFKKDLENVLNTMISDEMLIHSLTVYNRIRRGIQRIYEIRREYPDIIKGSDIYNIVKSSMIMDRNLLPQKLDEIITALESQNKEKTTTKHKRLILAGGVCSHPDIYGMIEDAGGVVVWDDFCTGSRYFGGILNTSIDPITAIAERYFERVACPAKHSSLTGRAENILEMVKKNSAEGVIFLFLKFCDPHAFDYPYLKETLEREGIPSMVFEVEDPLPAEGQLKTRIEAFLEMI